MTVYERTSFDGRLYRNVHACEPMNTVKNDVNKYVQFDVFLIKRLTPKVDPIN